LKVFVTGETFFSDFHVIKVIQQPLRDGVCLDLEKRKRTVKKKKKSFIAKSILPAVWFVKELVKELFCQP
jgi:hypothetical protein